MRLPLSWDDPATRLAIERYMAGGPRRRPVDARGTSSSSGASTGWTPSTTCYRTVFDASYLVLGLGDVYLGAPVATPLDPRHRLVTTKYNPARTWTAENSVGIGGAYLCIYGMEGPGGYQFVGRTVQVWNRWRRGGLFDENPWLLRFFDRIGWYPVSADELLELRAETDAGRGAFETEEGDFSLADARARSWPRTPSRSRLPGPAGRGVRRREGALARVRRVRRASRARRRAAARRAATCPRARPPCERRSSPPCGRSRSSPGSHVTAGDQVLSLEAMKMETPMTAPVDGEVLEVYVKAGEQVAPGRVLMAIGASS